MKRLFLIRHGKSSWDHNLQDQDRPLKKRGYKDAALVLDAFPKAMGEPEKIWSSFATRALETAKLFKEKFKVAEDDFQIRRDLYTFNSKELLQIIKSCDNSINRLMIFGHNPAITEVVNFLGSEFFENIPTTGLCIIDFETEDWKVLEEGKTVLHLFPKHLK